MYKRNILFDFDGTLFDTSPGILRCLRVILEKNGYDAHTDRWLHRFIGPPMLEALREFYEMDGQEAERIKDEYRELYTAEGVKECAPMPGARECLQRLRAAGAKIAIATSKPYYLTEEILHRFAFYDYFDAICGAESDAHSGKAEIVRRAMERLDARAEDTVMIGDRKYDVLGAKAWDVPCIGYDSGFAEPGEFARAGAIAVVKDFAALEKILLSE